SGTAVDGAARATRWLRGKWVLVNFFATGCIPCRQEPPGLVRFAQRDQAGGDAAVIGVIFDDDVASVRRLVTDNGVAWPILPDPGGHIAFQFGVRGPPESFLLDPQGNIVSKIIGTVQADALDRLLDEAKRRG